MTILYIDLEHERVLRDPVRAPGHAARVDAARKRLAEAAGEPCEVVRFLDVTPEEVLHRQPSAVVISGITTDYEHYDFGALEGLFEVIRTVHVPILGICAGHQFIGLALGAGIGPLGPLHPGEIDPDPSYAPGQRKEAGFMPLDVDTGCRLFRGLPAHPRFFQDHYWELKELPPGFAIRARSAWCANQAMECLHGPIFGVQFHPERYDDEHPEGGVLLRNVLAGARAPASRAAP